MPFGPPYNEAANPRAAPELSLPQHRLPAGPHNSSNTPITLHTES